MKRSYAYLLAAVGIVAAISGVAIAQQKTAPVAASSVAKTEAAPATVAAPVAAPVAAFDIKSVQTMPVGAERGKAIAAGICASCHAADGNSTVPLQPKLAGQHEAYLLKQLRDFKAVEGATEPARAQMMNMSTGQLAISTMGGQVGALSDDDMKSLAMWFSSQKLSPPDVAKQDDPALSKLGERIYRGGIMSKNLPACAGCHGPTGAGIMAKYPRVSGQFSDYLVAQLRAFREDGRKNSVPMQDIAKRMTDAEIAAVADYMAGVR